MAFFFFFDRKMDCSSCQLEDRVDRTAAPIRGAVFHVLLHSILEITGVLTKKHGLLHNEGITPLGRFEIEYVPDLRHNPES